jgi:hypothetical protein
VKVPFGVVGLGDGEPEAVAVGLGSVGVAVGRLGGAAATPVGCDSIL